MKVWTGKLRLTGGRTSGPEVTARIAVKPQRAGEDAPDVVVDVSREDDAFGQPRWEKSGPFALDSASLCCALVENATSDRDLPTSETPPTIRESIGELLTLARAASKSADVVQRDPSVAVVLAEPFADRRDFIVGMSHEGTHFIAPGHRGMRKMEGHRFDVVLMERGADDALVREALRRLRRGGFACEVFFDREKGVGILKTASGAAGRTAEDAMRTASEKLASLTPSTMEDVKRGGVPDWFTKIVNDVMSGDVVPGDLHHDVPSDAEVVESWTAGEGKPKTVRGMAVTDGENVLVLRLNGNTFKRGAERVIIHSANNVVRAFGFKIDTMKAHNGLSDIPGPKPPTMVVLLAEKLYAARSYIAGFFPENTRLVTPGETWMTDPIDVLVIERDAAEEDISRLRAHLSPGGLQIHVAFDRGTMTVAPRGEAAFPGATSPMVTQKGSPPTYRPPFKEGAIASYSTWVARVDTFVHGYPILAGERVTVAKGGSEMFVHVDKWPAWRPAIPLSPIMQESVSADEARYGCAFITGVGIAPFFVSPAKVREKDGKFSLVNGRASASRIYVVFTGRVSSLFTEAVTTATE